MRFLYLDDCASKAFAWLCLPALLAFALLAAGSAEARIIHRYSFTSDASDSVGGAHGTVIDPGVPTHVFQGGSLDLSANSGEGSDVITEDAYVDLPNGIVSDAVDRGTAGAVTLEFWATLVTTRTWQRFGDFGTSDNGEDTSDVAWYSPYLYVSPNSGRSIGSSDGLAITNHAPGVFDQLVSQPGPFPTSVETHVVAVYDHTDPSGGANGTMTLYRDGTPVGIGAIDPGLDLGALPDDNNWLGRSQWPDPTFDGIYDEFRIHDTALGAAEVAESFALGPDTVPVPEPAAARLLVACGVSLWAIGASSRKHRNANAISALNRRRRRSGATERCAEAAT